MFENIKKNKIIVDKITLNINELKLESNMSLLIYKYSKDLSKNQVITDFILENFEELKDALTTTSVLKLNSSKLIFVYCTYLYNNKKNNLINIALLVDRLFFKRKAMLLAELGMIINDGYNEEIEDYLLELNNIEAVFEYAVNSKSPNLKNIEWYALREYNKTNDPKILLRFSSIKNINTKEFEEELIYNYKINKTLKNLDCLFKYCYTTNKINNKKELRDIFLQSKNKEYIVLYALVIDPLLINYIGDLKDLYYLSNINDYSKEENYIFASNEFQQISQKNNFGFYTKVKKK